MSFILDALKKSEAERQRQIGPALLEMPIAQPARRLPHWAMAVGSALILGIVVLGWLAWHPAAVRTVAAPAAAPAAIPAAIPAAATPVAGAPARVTDAGSPVLEAVPAQAQAPAAARPAAADASDNPADNEPAVAPAAGELPGNGGTGNLHNYAELSGTLPALRLDLHVYAASPADRYAFINMHKVREGDVTPEGVQVRQITRDGVVLEFRGTEFVLGRQ